MFLGRARLVEEEKEEERRREWQTKNVTTMDYMFAHAESFNQPIGEWRTENVTTMKHMFSYAKSFNQPIAEWRTENVTTMFRMFDHGKMRGRGSFNLGNLLKQTLADGITSVQPQSKLVLQRMLVGWLTNQEETEVQCGPPNSWDVSKITDMSELFRDEQLREFNDPIGDWDVRNVVNMEYMFSDAKSFNQPIGEWQTENVTTMEAMFCNTKWFNQHNHNNRNTAQKLDASFREALMAI